jgi:hypothetical protein
MHVKEITINCNALKVTVMHLKSIAENTTATRQSGLPVCTCVLSLACVLCMYECDGNSRNSTFFLGAGNSRNPARISLTKSTAVQARSLPEIARN